jgi:ferrous iron transport protein B
MVEEYMNTKRVIKIGLAGNPNSGKTTVFNAITGANQKVGNYPGVTVEKKEGRRIYDGVEFRVFDLPGTYSLTAYSADEVVTRDFIIDEKPDIVIDVLDSTNIERNLYLCLQLQELGIPVVGALNIVDQAESMGILIDEKKLAGLLGIPMIRTVGTKGRGIEDLLSAVIAYYDAGTPVVRLTDYGPELEAEIKVLVDNISKDSNFTKKYSPRWIAIKLLERDQNVLFRIEEHTDGKNIKKKAFDSTKKIGGHFGRDSEIVVSEQRYAYVHGAVVESVRKVEKSGSQISEWVDRVLINRVLGLPIFLFVIWAIFQTTFTLGEYPMVWMETFFSRLSETASVYIPQGLVHSLVVDGIIGGVGGVFSFVPLIIILFLLLSFLEDSGYMARAAFITDKFLHLFGLHGQSFMPMMLGFGCSVPAIMAARTLKSQRDRILTILILPFMSCSAKLPVYVLLAAAFFPKNAGNVVMSIYLIGVVLALISSIILSNTVLKGKDTPFVMELPPYRMPTLKGVLWHVWEKTWMYLKKAGTVILAAAILIWFITTFPVMSEDGAKYDSLANAYRVEHSTDKDLSAAVESYVETIKSEDKLEYSVAGRIGKFIEPAIRPVGFDWKIGISAVTGFAAKEVVVSTLGVLYKVGTEENEESESLREAIQKDKVFNPLVAYGLMLFTLIVAPCFAALSVMGSEAGWKWVGFHFVYTVSLAWLICFTVYQTGKALGVGM